MKVKRQTKRSKILSVCSFVIVGLLLVFVVLVIVFKIQNKPLFVFGRSSMYVLTNSMEPDIPEGSYIIIEKITADDVRVGDIITFYSDDPTILGQMNTHEVVEINDDGTFATMGIHNGKRDEYPARAENVVGRFVRVSSVLTFFAGIMRTRGGLIAVLFLIIVVCFGVYLPDLLRYLHTKRQLLEEEKQQLMQKKIQEEVERLKQQSAEEE